MTGRRIQLEQRWRDRRGILISRGRFDPSLHGVEIIPGDKVAAAFVQQHHYSASYPSASFRVGLYRLVGKGPAARKPELVGVAVFGTSPGPQVARKWAGPGVEALDLNRFILLDELEYNAETWFLRGAFEQLERERPDVRAVYAFSDPYPRTTLQGEVIMPGHIGTIYKSFRGGMYLGRGDARWKYLDAQGRVVSGAGLKKFYTQEKGATRFYEKLIERGAPPIRRGESPGDYFRRAMEEGPFRRFRHPGTHGYIWPLKGRHGIHPLRKSYQRRALPPPEQIDVDFLSLARTLKAED